MNEETQMWIELASDQAEIAWESVLDAVKEFVTKKDAENLADQAWANTIRFELWSPESKTLKEMGPSEKGIIAGNIIEWLKKRARDWPESKKYAVAQKLLEQGWFAFK